MILIYFIMLDLSTYLNRHFKFWKFFFEHFFFKFFPWTFLSGLFLLCKFFPRKFWQYTFLNIILDTIYIHVVSVHPSICSIQKVHIQYIVTSLLIWLTGDRYYLFYITSQLDNYLLWLSISIFKIFIVFVSFNLQVSIYKYSRYRFKKMGYRIIVFCIKLKNMFKNRKFSTFPEWAFQNGLTERVNNQI